MHISPFASSAKRSLETVRLRAYLIFATLGIGRDRPGLPPRQVVLLKLLVIRKFGLRAARDVFPAIGNRIADGRRRRCVETVLH